MNEMTDFIASITAEVQPLYRTYSLAEWDAAVSGTPAAHERYRQVQAEYMRFWADPRRYAIAKRLYESLPKDVDPLLARQIKLIYLTAAQNQQDEATIERVTALDAETRAVYYTYRAEIDGRRLSDNELTQILTRSHDSQEVRQAWEASKQVGRLTAAAVRELARLRNAAARRQGFRDHFQRSLTLDEIDESRLLDLLTRLEAETAAPFAQLKTEIDRARAEHFGVAPSDLRPWHYGDRFFQDPPAVGTIDMDALFAGADPVQLARVTYAGLGLEVDDVLERSDLYARPGKDQHAFCIDIDREGDVRTLNNLEPNRRWTETLLHELGHAVYHKYVDPVLPWLLRNYAHTLVTEAVALFMGALIYEPEWLQMVLGLSAAEAARLAAAAAEQERAARLVFTRWSLVVTHFERGLYADPERDLNDLWWNLVEKYQGLTRPDDRRHGDSDGYADWSAKIHIALHPVYYHNYMLGHLTAAQVRDRLVKDNGGIVGRQTVGRWLVERIFRPGASCDWETLIHIATGEILNPRYFVDACRRPRD